MTADSENTVNILEMKDNNLTEKLFDNETEGGNLNITDPLCTEDYKNPSLELIYGIDDKPPWYLCILLAFQHYILAFGGIIAIPLILAEPLCVKHDNTVKSQLMCTIFFVSGICTLLQTTIGTRLPILQGGTFSLITPTMAILSLPQWKCQNSDVLILNGTENFSINNTESWQSRIREVERDELEQETVLGVGDNTQPSLISSQRAVEDYDEEEDDDEDMEQLSAQIEDMTCTPVIPSVQRDWPEDRGDEEDDSMFSHRVGQDTEVMAVESLAHMADFMIQGAIIVASFFQVFLGFSGLIGLLLKFIGPLSITPTITLIGLSLFDEAGKKCGSHWGIAVITVVLIIIFSQYLRQTEVPFISYSKGKWKISKYPVFKLFPVLLGMCLSWLICYILTHFNVFPRNPTDYGFAARTDINIDAIDNSPWFHIPYPGQWGWPTVSLSSVLGMLSGILSSTVESIGDYYTCAKLSGAPNPPTHALNRGIGMEGLGCILAGIWGTGNGTTSYSQNIAALGITKVGSRIVMQTAGILLIILGLFGKFGAIFITIPEPVIGGMFMVMFGMIAAVGMSNLQYVDLNSSRNLFVLGFSMFTGLVIPTWLESHPGMISTGVNELDQTITVLLTTKMFVGGFLGCLLDNTIPGSDEERGTSTWHKQMHAGKTNGSQGQSCYDLPFVTKYLRRLSGTRYIPFLPTFQMDRN